MKKLIVILAVAFAFAVTAKAQMCVHAAYGIDRLTFTGGHANFHHFAVGYSKDITLGIGAKVGLDYGATWKMYKANDADTKANFLAIPVHAKVYLPMGATTKFFAAPGFAANLGLFGSKGVFGDGMIKRFNLAVDGDLGVIFASMIKVAVGYEYSLTKFQDLNIGNHLGSIRFTVGVVF